ncbi:MAG: terpene cyclase/mutase family protein, partial [Candidatus Zixiibacteriota bacterium]
MFGLIAVSQAHADINQMIQDGIDYLEDNQDPTSGFWGTDKETPHRDGAVVVDVLARLEANYTVDPDILDDGYQAVYYMSTSSTDYLARKIIASASVNGVVNPYLIDSLVNMQNNDVGEDGGWGYQKDYGSNTLETALAIKALVAASYEDPTPSVLTPAGNFLVATQNYDPGGGDYGWGFVDEGDSKVLFTAHAVTALSALQDNYTGYDFSTQIADAFIWLQNVQHGDEGFGSNIDYSNAYETGLAICAMIAHDPAAWEIKDAWGYLEDTQQQDGGWDDDAYSTAMAISGLNCIDPDAFLYEYLAGDANMYVGGWPPAVNGLDVTYL